MFGEGGHKRGTDCEGRVAGDVEGFGEEGGVSFGLEEGIAVLEEEGDGGAGFEG